MEITGKIIQILEKQSGKTSNGKWENQEFILETDEQYPKKVCIAVWNNKVSIDNLLNKKVKCFINIQSREYNNKWFTNVTIWKIESLETEINNPKNEPKHPVDEINDLPWDNIDDNEEPPF